MDIHITWYPPLPLSGGNPADLRYTVDGIKAWEDCPGVYMFCCWDHERVIPLYIGRAKNIYERIRQHVETTRFMRRIKNGFDHGVGHPLLLLGDTKAPNCRKNKAFKDLGHYSEWPKVADAVIEA